MPADSTEVQNTEIDNLITALIAPKNLLEKVAINRFLLEVY